MKVKVWKCKTIERDVNRFVERTRYVEAKTRQTAKSNLCNLLCIAPKDVVVLTDVPELS